MQFCMKTQRDVSSRSLEQTITFPERRAALRLDVVLPLQQQVDATGQACGMKPATLKAPLVTLCREFLHSYMRQIRTSLTSIWISSHVRTLSRSCTHRYLRLIHIMSVKY